MLRLKNLQAIVLILFVLILGAPGLSPTAVAQPALTGSWLADWINDAPSYYRQFSRHFTDTTMVSTTKTVIDSPAQGFYAMDIEMHYTYTLGAAVTGHDIPVYEIDLVPQRVMLIPQSVSAAGFFRNVSECGINQWEVGVAVDVTGRLCPQTGPEYPWFRAGENRSYEILGVGDGFLRGAELENDARYNGTSPAARTRRFTPFVFKQP